MSFNGMHGSKALESIFQAQPGPSELQVKIDAMLAQLGASRTTNPEIQEAIGRIGSIAQKIESLAGETYKDLARLHVDTIVSTGLLAYESSVSVLTTKQSNYINDVLSGKSIALLASHQVGRMVRPASNDSDFSQTA